MQTKMYYSFMLSLRKKYTYKFISILFVSIIFNQLLLLSSALPFILYKSEVADLTQSQQSIFFSQNLRDIVIIQEDIDKIISTVNRFNAHMRNLGTEISIDYIFSEKIIYLSFSFFKNNTGYFRLYGFYNENVSYLIDQPSSLGQDSSTTLFDVLFVQMSSQSSVSIGENISLTKEEIEGKKIEIHVKDVINMNTIRDNDILNFYSSDAADLIFICRFDTLLTLVSILRSL